MDIWSNLSEIVSSIGSSLVSAFTTISKIFYTPGASGAEGTITFVGYLALGALAISVLSFAFGFITKLITRRMGR